MWRTMANLYSRPAAEVYDDEIYQRAIEDVICSSDLGGQRQPHDSTNYFWHAGTEMQKSPQGLFQSLLYCILRSTLQLVDAIFRDHSQDDLWSIAELKSVFKALSNHPSLGSKFYFFIDGLDEYGGTEVDIIGLVKDLAKSQHIKVCVSSRPWSAFRQEWRTSIHTLKIQDFTKDMAKYVKENLVDSPKFLNVSSQDCRRDLPQG
jgi:hypothetical protein